MDRELAQSLVDHCLGAGASYVEVRQQRTRRQDLTVKDGQVGPLSDGESLGLGVRVLVDGAWGFGSAQQLSEAGGLAAADSALALARAAARQGMGGVTLSPLEASQGTYRTRVRIDPLELKLQDKLEPLTEAEERLRGAGIDEIRSTLAKASFRREDRLLVTSEGCDIYQELTESGAMMQATAVAGGDMQVRSYPNGRSGLHRTAGFEVIEQLDLPSHAQRVAEEAHQLVHAEQCPSGLLPAIIDGTQMALQIHESVGHPTELDRVLGSEVSLAGDSFMTPDLLDTLQFGTADVTLRADATYPGGLGTYGYDDEGVPAADVVLVRDGTFCGYQSSREDAARLGVCSSGAGRAVGPNHIPLVRMSNICLDPGDWSLDEMMAEAGDGIYLEGIKTGSIDQKRLNFQFGPELGRLIVDGAPGPLVKNPVYSGTTVEFWNSCLGVGTSDLWQMWAIPTCGKGQPGQTARVGHGSAPALFADLRLGVD